MFYQIALRPTNGLGMVFPAPPLDVKNDVMKNTCAAQTPNTRNILRTDIHVCVDAVDYVTKYND